MKYKNLQSLLQNSSSSRKFILSLPVEKQLILHDEFDASIHSAADLHNVSQLIDLYKKQIKISEEYDSLFKIYKD